MNQTHTHRRPASVHEVTRHFELSGRAVETLAADLTPQAFFTELVKQGCFPDAVHFAAHYLLPREAVWWGSLCLWQVIRDQPVSAEHRVLDEVVMWVIRPTDCRRRGLKELAGADARLSRQLARAAFYCGETLAPVDQPPVAPPAGIPASIVAQVVLQAARRSEAPAACLRHFLSIAGEVSRGETDDVLERLPATNSIPSEVDYAGRA